MSYIFWGLILYTLWCYRMTNGDLTMEQTIINLCLITLLIVDVTIMGTILYIAFKGL